MIDWDKPYGECGRNSYGWKFYQDGKYFNKKGEEVVNEEEMQQAEEVEEPTEALISPMSDEKPKRVGRPRQRKKVA